MAEIEETEFIIRPSMPDIRVKLPDFQRQGESHLLGFYTELPSFSASGRFHYTYVVAIFRRPGGRVMGFITLEQSSSMSNAFCMFDEFGKHHNFGELPDDHAFEAFWSGAGILLREKYGIFDDNWEPV